MADKSLANYEYDKFLASKGKTSKSARQDLEKRKGERTNKGYKGWHWGLGDRPVKCKDKSEFKAELSKRGLMMRDEVSKPLR